MSAVHIPGYEILGELGRGGMGVVYKARHFQLGRVVALKMILSAEHAGDAELTRFRTEAEALARLQHPNIVQIFEVGEQGGRPFFALEFCPGGGLDRKLNGTPLPPKEAARLVETLARAVHAAHEQNVVHRDLKPANVLLAADGAPKITDFGLAKRLDEASRTQTGAVMGTPSYMAPEQAAGKGEEVGPAADVYALGAILYECLTGRPPFRGPTPLDTVLQVVADEPAPPRRLQPKTPRDLETICLKCLQKDPRKRYPAAEELAVDLGRFLDGRPIAARPVGAVGRAWRWARRNPMPAVLAAAAVLLVAALTAGALAAAWRERDLHTAADKARREAEDAAEESRRRLVRLDVAEGARRLDGGDYAAALAWFAEALGRDDGSPAREEVHRLRLAAVGGQCPELLRAWHAQLPAHYAEFSADGRYVLAACGGENKGWSVGDGEAVIWDAATGRPAAPLVRQRGYVIHACFSPDGRSFATACSDPNGVKEDKGGVARVWDVADATPRSPPLAHRFAVNHAAFSPDGGRLATASGPAFGPGGEARVWDPADGRPVTEPLPHAFRVNHVAFSRDGARLVTASGTAGGLGEVRVWDAATGRPLTPALPHGGPVTQAWFSPDGRRVLTASLDGMARLWDSDSGRLVLTLPHHGPVNAAAFSPDGGRVVTAGGDGLALLWDATSGRLLAPRLRHTGPVQHAAFSPDGLRVLTAAGEELAPEGEARVWDAATGAPLTPLLPHNGQVRFAAFSPDGGRILTLGGDGLVKLWGAPPGAFAPRPLGDGPSRVLALGGDGGLVVLAGSDHAVRVWDAGTGRPAGPALPHPEAPDRAVLSRDGRRLLTAGPAAGGKTTEARVWDPADGRLLLGPTPLGAGSAAVTLSPDGRYVAFADGALVQVRDATTGEVVGAAMRHERPVLKVVFSPTDRYLAAVTGHGQESGSEVQLWETATGAPVTPPLIDDYLIQQVEFSGDERRIVTASASSSRGDPVGEGQARVWEVASGRPLGAPLRRRGGVNEARFSPDPEGRYVVTASRDDTAVVWNAAGDPVAPPLRHTGPVSGASFSADGRYVLTIRPESARLWDASSGEPVTPPLSAPWGLHLTALGPEGRSLITVGGESDGRTEVGVWDLRPSPLPAAEWSRRARLLSGRYINPVGGFVGLEPARLCEELGEPGP